MKGLIKIIFIQFFIFNSSFFILHAQVAINEDSSDPDASAMLDISGSDKGLLIPRMDSTSRNDISNPATGLMVYDTDNSSFWYYNGTAWSEVGSAAFISENDITHSVNNDDDFIFGADSINHHLGDEYKFFFNKDKGAFRTGKISNKNWDIDSLGPYSFGSGFNVKALGEYSTAFGGFSTASGDYSTAFGLYTEASGKYSTTFGLTTEASGDYSMAFGFITDATGYIATSLGAASQAVGDVSIAGGYYTIAPSYSETTLGMYNTIYTPNSATNYDSQDRLFVIGNGTDIHDRSDAFVIHKNGNTSLNGALTIDGSYTFPTTDGINGQVLTTDGSGNLTWVSSIAGVTSILQDTDGDTQIQVDENSVDDDIIRFDLNGTEFMRLDSGRLEILNTGGSIFIGEGAGENDNFDDNQNVFIGFQAGQATFYGGRNVLLGYQAGLNNDGSANSFVGYHAGLNTTTGEYNAALGHQAGLDNTTGEENLFLGSSAGYSNTTGNNNLYLGTSAGNNNETGSNNIFLGYRAGYNETNSNKLYIENSFSLTDAPLIYGDFDVDSLQINGTLNINGAFNFPTTDGINGQVLTTDGLGNLTWVSPITGVTSILQDTDGDTQIQVDKNSVDDDIIRFDLNGTEFMRLDSGRIEILNTGSSIFIGEGAGENDSFNDERNVFIGFQAGQASFYGEKNVLLGYQAGLNNDGLANSFVGYHAGLNTTTGEYNAALGYRAGLDNITGDENLFLGSSAGRSNTTGKQNLYLGASAGNNNETGSNNIFLGYRAGYNETNSNKLYIENSFSTTDAPLIYGDFDVDSLQINGTLNINGAFNFPTTDGAANQFLVTDGNGNLSWTTQNDNDNQTLSFENDTLTISNGNAVDLSDFARLNEDGLNVLITPQQTGTSTILVSQSSWNDYSSETFAWQSFTCTTDGYLSKVTIMQIEDFDGGLFRIYSGEGESNTPLLEIANGSVSLGAVSFDVTDYGISFSTGDIFTIYLEDTVDNDYRVYHDYNNSYSGGEVNYSSSGDMAFEVEYVSVIADLSIETPFIQINNPNSLNIGVNLSNIDTLYFEDGTYQSSSSYNAFQNFQLNDFWLSNDGDDEGININNNGNTTVSGQLTIGNAYTFPISDGAINQILSTDGNGTLAWTNFSLDSLSDADGNTKILINEDSKNDDIIRFDLGGTEFMRLDSGRIEVANTGYSIFIGNNAGANDDFSENANVFIGNSSGRYNTEGERNIFIGNGAGLNNSTGERNVFLGFNTGKSNLTGYQNVAVGYQAGFSNDSYKNVFLGYQAGYNETGNNKLYIENSDVASPLIYGEFDSNQVVINGNNGDNTNNRTLFVNGSIGATSAFNNDSDRRLKTNIQTIPNALDKILEMRGVTYQWKDGRETGDRMGFIAQEVEPILPEVVNNQNDHYTMQYAPITAVLVEAVKEQQQIIENQQTEIQTLKAQVEKINELEAKLEAFISNSVNQ